MRDSEEIARRLQGYRLTTAEVIYYMPDHPQILQSFIWQTLDLAPRFPRIARFLDHWRREIEAAIHSVAIAHDGGLAPSHWRMIDGEFKLH